MSSDFLTELTSLLKEHKTLTTQEIYAMFPDSNQKTISWHLHKQMLRGNIIQASHGVYVLPQEKYNIDDSIRVLGERSMRAFEALDDTGYDFYLSGLDALNGVGFTASGDYPTIVCAAKHRVKDVQLELMRLFDFAVTEDEYENINDKALKDKIQFVILSTDAMELSNEHFALIEKAFVDLYYAVTRMDYPISVTELPHILSLINPNPFRFKMATRDRHLSDELNFLINYNKDFLREAVRYL